MGGRLVARFVVLDAARCLAPGEVAWDADGRIVALRQAKQPRSGVVADVCVLPALVNAHAHLQLPALPDAPREFLPWVGAVLAARAKLDAAAERRLVRRAVADLLQSGAAAVGEIDATGRSAAWLDDLPIRGRCYRELTGFHLDAAGARALLGGRVAGAARAMASGLSPHAPYSVSAALFHAAAARSRHLAIHCAELPEEQQFLREGKGPFVDLLQRLGRLPADFTPPRVGAVRWLQRLGVLRPTTQLVHCQELERGDVARIAAAGSSIVVCPGTIEWFGRTPPPVPAWLQAGIPVGLGTDSRASNDGLSMQAELRRAARLWPQLSPAALLTMATAHGGRALGLRLGTLRRGAYADLLTIPAAADWQTSWAEFVFGRSRGEVRLGGRRQRRPASA
jgi:cytosine/adenosine deaminase-related metal-dependent hydrolase